MIKFSTQIGIGVGDAPALEIQLDDSTDTSDFFGAGNPGGASAGLQAREAMNAAAGFFEGKLKDDIDPIVESGFNSWTATFFHPSTGASGSAPGLSVAADTLVLVIFVGARDLGGTTSGGSTLGEAGPGAFGPTLTSGTRKLVDH
jgi:hypothetical protein